MAEKFGRELPGENPIGEAWEMVDRPEAQSVCTRTGQPYGAGTNLLLPYAWDGELICKEPCTVLITDRFVDV